MLQETKAMLGRLRFHCKMSEQLDLEMRLYCQTIGNRKGFARFQNVEKIVMGIENRMFV